LDHTKKDYVARTFAYLWLRKAFCKIMNIEQYDKEGEHIDKDYHIATQCRSGSKPDFWIPNDKKVMLFMTLYYWYVQS
jgi:hypothetical protein